MIGLHKIRFFNWFEVIKFNDETIQKNTSCKKSDVVPVVRNVPPYLDYDLWLGYVCHIQGLIVSNVNQKSEYLDYVFQFLSNSIAVIQNWFNSVIIIIHSLALIVI